MKTIFIALQDSESRAWSPVARVDKAEDGYHLSYTKGAEKVPGFEGFGRMRGLSSRFFSKELFPLLKNRVLPRSRPEYKAYATWLGLSGDYLDEFEELSRTGGLRGTDNIELIPLPEPTADGYYEAYFFVHGIRHLSKEVALLADSLNKGDPLYLARDVQNDYDGHALLLRTGVPVSVIGYVPRYYSHEFSCLLMSDPRLVRVEVERVNVSAPSPYRVLCRLIAPWPKDFAACKSESYQAIGAESGAVVDQSNMLG